MTKRFKSKKIVRNSLLYKYIFIILIFYIILKICINLILKIPIKYIFENYKLANIKNYVLSSTINKPNYLLMYYSDVKEKIADVSYVYNTVPLVYIYNTHQSEAYSDGKTVLDSSKYFKEELKKYKVETVVEESNIPEFMRVNNLNYNRSYYASSFFIKDALSKYTFSLIIDLHRDAIKYDASTTSINGKKYARVLFVIGGKNKNYKLNYSVADKINKKIKSKYSKLSRGIVVKNSVGNNNIYNQDLNRDMILIEIGSNENSYNEIKNTIDLLAPIIGEYLYE